MLVKELRLMSNWVRFHKLRNVMARAQERAIIMKEGGGSETKSNSKTAASDMVKLYDTLMQHATEALELDGVKESQEDARELMAMC